MARHLDEELNQLNTDLLKMAAYVEEAIHKSVEAFQSLNVEQAETVIREDERIDELENRVEKEAIEILALFQPMAGDLRFITTAMRVTTELERIADLVVNICQRTRDLSTQQARAIPALEAFSRLSEVAKWMVRSAIDAFVRRDEALAREVIFKDKEANALRTMILNDLIEKHMVKDGRAAVQTLPLVLATRDLERICDQAKAIAEDIFYLVEARIVKHHPERLEPS